MNYTLLVKEIRNAALKQPNVNSFYEGDVYDVWHHTTKYSSVVCSLEGMQRLNNAVAYNIILYYGDRPIADNANKIAIYDDGLHVLQSILDMLPDEVEYSAPISYTPFEQSFEDVIDGCWVRVALEVPYEIGLCGMDDEEYVPKTIDITENGKHIVDGYDFANVAVVDEESKERIEELENEIAEIDAAIEEERSTEINANGEYIAEDKLGWNKVNVDIPLATFTTSVTTGVHGSFQLDAPEGYEGIKHANIYLTTPTEERTYDITENGTIVILPRTGAEGGGWKALTKATINVAVPSVTAVEITQAEYDALEEYDDNKIYLITE